MKLKNRVLAVLALALLIINMLPVRVAEAAASVTVKTRYYGEKEFLLSGYENWVAISRSENLGVEWFILYDNILSIDSQGVVNGMFFTFDRASVYSGTFEVPDVKVNASVGYQSNCYYLSPATFTFNGVSYGGNYVPPAGYSFTAPYLKDVTFSNENLYYTAGNSDFDLSSFRFLFDIVDNGPVYLNRSVQFSGYVCLPSKEFLEQAKEDFLGGRKTFENYYKIYSGAYYPEWVKTIDIASSTTFKKWPIKFEVECGDFLNYSISYSQLFELVEQCNNVDLMDYYDTDRIPVEDFLKCYLWIQRLDGVVYTEYADAINYGNLTSFIFSGYLKEPVVGIGYSDPFLAGPPVDFIGPMLPDTDVQQNINQAYRDALEQAMKDNALEDNLDIDLDSENLFDSFKDFAGGLLNLSGSFKGIVLAVGNVFAFFPKDFTLLLYGGIVVLILVSIIKAIRR